MTADRRSPRISDMSWGRLQVAGLGAFKDAKLYPGGAREWDWRETGTRHLPGIQPADVAELLAHGAEVVVLSKGVLERLQVCPETLDLLKNKGIPTHVLPTEGCRPAVQRARGETEGRRPVPFHLLSTGAPVAPRFDAPAQADLCFPRAAPSWWRRHWAVRTVARFGVAPGPRASGTSGGILGLGGPS